MEGSDAPLSASAPRRGVLWAILLISAATLAYEVALTRVFSIGQWHHFAYMIISVALLGFAASGTALALLRPWVTGREEGLFRLGALLLALALPGCYALGQRIPFETFQLLVRPVQLWYLFLLYLVLSLPFFFASTCIALGFLMEPRRVGRVYFFNMFGSGLGAASVVGLLFALSPAQVPYLLSGLPVLGYLLVTVDDAGDERGGWLRVVRAVVPAALVLLPVALPLLATGVRDIRVSEYKGLSYALDLPDVEVVGEAQSPLSVVTAVSSPFIRVTPGQISNYPMEELGPLPEQVALYFDADAVSVVHRFDGSLDAFAFLDHVTSALPYRILERPHTLVIGSGGGTEVLSALHHRARHVTAVEVDPGVFRLLRGPLEEFSGGLYGRSDVTPVLADGRGYLESRPEQTFDLIQISLLDSFNASSAGVRALSESYLYTVEAVELYLRRLSPGGALAVTRWLKAPPRDAIKMFATLVEAAERAGIEEPSSHLAFIRSWNTATLLLSRAPLTEQQIVSIRSFAGERGFDLAWVPGIAETEVNRFTILEEPIYWRASARLLSPDREAFYDEFLFHVKPATDDRPYYFRFFKWGSLTALREAAGTQWVNFVEWGQLILLATIGQALVASLLLVLAPLLLAAWWRGRRRARGSSGAVVARVIFYFAALGLAYLLLEIAFIQKFMRFLAYPVYAIAVVLTAFLVFSGLGSAYADRHREAPGRLVATAVLLIAGFCAAYLLLLPRLFSAWSGWPDAARIFASLALLGPLAFLMGIPFPRGLQLVSDQHPSMLPWAWAVNGAASVIGAGLATLIAVHFGFAAVIGLAVGLYVAAAGILGSWRE